MEYELVFKNDSKLLCVELNLKANILMILV